MSYLQGFQHQRTRRGLLKSRTHEIIAGTTLIQDVGLDPRTKGRRLLGTSINMQQMLGVIE
jgi:hypothetical protein